MIAGPWDSYRCPKSTKIVNVRTHELIGYIPDDDVAQLIIEQCNAALKNRPDWDKEAAAQKLIGALDKPRAPATKKPVRNTRPRK